MRKKIQHSFWGGFVVALIISFVYFYVVWPRPPVEERTSEKVTVILPKAGEKAGIYYPVDGDKVTGIFIVYGSGSAFENQGGIEITDVTDQTLLAVPVYFQVYDMGRTGPFITTLNLNQIKNLPENGKINLYTQSPKDGKKIILDSKNVRFK